MIVVDTNVLAYFYIPGEHSSAAARVYKKDPVWIAPSLWRSEFRSALLQYVRQGILGQELAHAIMEEAVATMQGAEFEMDSYPVLEIAFQSNLSAYDSEFVALAQQFSVPLVTSNRKVVRQFSGIAISMEDFVAD